MEEVEEAEDDVGDWLDTDDDDAESFDPLDEVAEMLQIKRFFCSPGARRGKIGDAVKSSRQRGQVCSNTSVDHNMSVAVILAIRCCSAGRGHRRLVPEIGSS
eukprot:1083363-Amphidinium_carterae.1